MASFAAAVRLHHMVFTPVRIGLVPIQRNNLTVGLFQNKWKRPQVLRGLGNRHLYSASTLGLENYVSVREKVAIQFENLHESFRESMVQVLESETQNMIFTEDLKNAVHLAEPTEEDLSLIIRMAKKFNKQHEGLRFGRFVFGPVFMRMFHHHNQPDAAMQAWKAKELEGFFDQISTYHILMDLLYENEKYQDVLDVFCNLQEKRLNGVKYSKMSITLALAACYKMNSHESFETMKEILKGAHEYGIDINRRSIIFAVALALNQNFPDICLELLSRIHMQNQITIRNLKIMALTDLGRVEDTLPVFRSVLDFDVPDTHPAADKYKRRFIRETIEKVEQAVRATSNKELILEFEYVSKNLKEYNFISEKTLDDLVCQQIEHTKPSFQDQDRAMLASSFNRNSRNPKQLQRNNDNRSHPSLLEVGIKYTE